MRGNHGTNFKNIDQQCVVRLTSAAKRHLYVCTNRGSEIYSFSPAGDPFPLFRRLATVDENHALDRSVSRFLDLLRAHGLEAHVIWGRMNRRKIDLIPVDPWKNPKKEDAPALLRAVQDRLGRANFHSLAELSEAAIQIAKEDGLKDPKVTSDIKHIEIGLTDKGDSIRWLRDHLLVPNEIAAEDVVIVGDEFGGVGELKGSDSMMRVEGMETATYTSVGAEPFGTPEWVIHEGGGPLHFLEILRTQVRASEDDPSWKVEQVGFDPSREREMEPIFAIGNGFLGVRGSASIPLPSSEDDLFVAGIYDKKITLLPYSEALISEERTYSDAELVSFPSPLSLSLLADGDSIKPDTTEISQMRRTLDLRSASVVESVTFELKPGSNLRIDTTRIASLADPHLLLQKIEIHSTEDHSVELTPRMRIEELLPNHPHLMISSRNETVAFRTRSSSMEVCYSSRIFVAGVETDEKTSGPIRVGPDRPLNAWRIVSIFSSRESQNPAQAALDHINAIRPSDIEIRIADHLRTWKEFWACADIQFDGCPESSQSQRFGAYQLRISTDHDPHVSIGAKGLTGRAYEGHVFWDTEIFAFPFFLHRSPEIARSLLLYRYHTLAGARERARTMNCEGACFAWESTLSGRDVTPERLSIQTNGKMVGPIPIFTGRQQIHITADVAFSISKYWDATLDAEFMIRSGIDILVETARFWATRVTERKGTFHIDGVVGPDEYHHDVNDNAFTNTMAQFDLDQSLAMTDWLRENSPAEWEKITRRLGLRTEELKRWRAVSESFFIPPPNDKGVIEQFEGFFQLKPVPTSSRRELRAQFWSPSTWEEINGYRVVKQADVLMIPYLFPQRFSRELCTANFDYYEPITDHASSLSPCVHAAIAFRAGRDEAAEKYWELSRNMDLLNLMKNTSFGVHIGAIGGTWQTLMFHFLKVFQPGSEPRFIPENCRGISFNLKYRGETKNFCFGDREKKGAAA